MKNTSDTFEIERVKPQYLFLFSLIFSAIATCILWELCYDAMDRYVPAAEAFARGDWQYAFHPRFGVVFSALAGTIAWLFHVNGIIACKALCMIFYSLAVFPLYDIFKRLYGEKAAFWGILCYIFFVQMVRYMATGLREPGCVLAIGLAVHGLLTLDKNCPWRNIVEWSVGCALLTMLRGEGALIVMIGFIIFFWRVKSWRPSICAVFLFLLLIAPQLYYNVRAVGYPVPEVRHALILQQMGVPPFGDSIFTLR